MITHKGIIMNELDKFKNLKFTDEQIVTIIKLFSKCSTINQIKISYGWGYWKIENTIPLNRKFNTFYDALFNYISNYFGFLRLDEQKELLKILEEK